MEHKHNRSRTNHAVALSKFLRSKNFKVNAGRNPEIKVGYGSTYAHIGVDMVNTSTRGAVAALIAEELMMAGYGFQMSHSDGLVFFREVQFAGAERVDPQAANDFCDTMCDAIRQARRFEFTRATGTPLELVGLGERNSARRTWPYRVEASRLRADVPELSRFVLQSPDGGYLDLFDLRDDVIAVIRAAGNEDVSLEVAPEGVARHAVAHVGGQPAYRLNLPA